MSEKMTAFPISGKASVDIEIEKRTKLDAGRLEEKHIIEGKVGSRPVSLIERKYEAAYVQNWEAFRAAGLPVVPTLRKSSRDTLLVTDIKVDGSEVYGKGFLNMLHATQRERLRPELDAVFLELTDPINFPVIEAKVQEYVVLANKRCVELPWDDAFELVVHPDKTWELMILDLYYGKVFNSERSNPRLLVEAKKK